MEHSCRGNKRWSTHLSESPKQTLFCYVLYVHQQLQGLRCRRRRRLASTLVVFQLIWAFGLCEWPETRCYQHLFPLLRLFVKH